MAATKSPATRADGGYDEAPGDGVDRNDVGARCAAAFANFHLFQVEQLFSNADGTVQFIVMHEFAGMNGENLWTGNKLTSTHAGVSKTYHVQQESARRVDGILRRDDAEPDGERR